MDECEKEVQDCGCYSAYKVPAKLVFQDAKHIRVQSFKDDISNNLIECFNK